MTTTFTTYTALLAQARNALANRDWQRFYIQKIQNSKDMETSYTQLGNVSRFIDWLEMKAKLESEGDSGALQFCIGGN